MQTRYYFDRIVTDSRNVKLTGYLVIFYYIPGYY
jgi:hypothetical protein